MSKARLAATEPAGSDNHDVTWINANASDISQLGDTRLTNWHEYLLPSAVPFSTGLGSLIPDGQTASKNH